MVTNASQHIKNIRKEHKKQSKVGLDENEKRRGGKKWTDLQNRILLSLDKEGHLHLTTLIVKNRAQTGILHGAKAASEDASNFATALDISSPESFYTSLLNEQVKRTERGVFPRWSTNITGPNIGKDSLEILEAKACGQLIPESSSRMDDLWNEQEVRDVLMEQREQLLVPLLHQEIQTFQQEHGDVYEQWCEDPLFMKLVSDGELGETKRRLSKFCRSIICMRVLNGIDEEVLKHVSPHEVYNSPHYLFMESKFAEKSPKKELVLKVAKWMVETLKPYEDFLGTISGKLENVKFRATDRKDYVGKYTLHHNTGVALGNGISKDELQDFFDATYTREVDHFLNEIWFDLISITQSMARNQHGNTRGAKMLESTDLKIGTAQYGKIVLQLVSKKLLQVSQMLRGIKSFEEQLRLCQSLNRSRAAYVLKLSFSAVSNLGDMQAETKVGIRTVSGSVAAPYFPSQLPLMHAKLLELYENSKRVMEREATQEEQE